MSTPFQLPVSTRRVKQNTIQSTNAARQTALDTAASHYRTARCMSCRKAAARTRRPVASRKGGENKKKNERKKKKEWNHPCRRPCLQPMLPSHLVSGPHVPSRDDPGGRSVSRGQGGPPCSRPAFCLANTGTCEAWLQSLPLLSLERDFLAEH